MNKIYGVYFICCINHYLDIVHEQFDILEKGLLQETEKLIIFVTNFNENNVELDFLLERFNQNNKFYWWNLLFLKQKLVIKYF